VHRGSAREDGNTACWKAMFRSRTVDDSVTYWFPWKHPMARRQGLEFGILDRHHENGLVGWALQASLLDRLSATKLPQPKHRLCPSGLAIRLFWHLCMKTQPSRASQMHQAQIFCSLDVCLAVLDMLRSTPTTLSVLY